MVASMLILCCSRVRHLVKLVRNILITPPDRLSSYLLSFLAGHGDLHNQPLAAVQDYCKSISPATKVVDGVDEVSPTYAVNKTLLTSQT